MAGAADIVMTKSYLGTKFKSFGDPFPVLYYAQPPHYLDKSNVIKRLTAAFTSATAEPSFGRKCAARVCPYSNPWITIHRTTSKHFKDGNNANIMGAIFRLIKSQLFTLLKHVVASSCSQVYGMSFAVEVRC